MTNVSTDETSAVIARVSLELFATVGYDATSVRDIASAVGIKGASLYYHFESKEHILWALTDAALTNLADRWQTAKADSSPSDPTDALRLFVRTGAAYHAENRTEATIVNSQMQRLSEAHRAQAVELRRLYELELTTIVNACVDSGQHSVPDVRITVYALLQMSAAIATWFNPDGPLTVGQVCDAYEILAVKMLSPGYESAG